MLQRIALALAALTLGAAPAGAVSFPLTVQLGGGGTGTYGNVEVTESGGDLGFALTLGPSLGATRDLHELYFNLTDGFTGLAISSTDTVNTAYTLSANPAVSGGAGASFDWGVNFGNGAGPPGNGQRVSATFVLSANEALSVDDLRITSSTNGANPIVVFMAVHPQGSGISTVGSPVPEPTTGALLVLGLSGLAGIGRRTSQRKRA
jgi:hypothetical protein